MERLTMAKLLENAPSNWGRWGADDEIGSLNHLTSAEVLRGVAAVRQGRVFTLGTRIAAPGGDPLWPGRAQAQRYNTQDSSTYAAGKVAPAEGGMKYADDVIMMFLQGSTHADALAHAWYGDQVYNGYDAATNTDSLAKASALAIAERGLVGRGVLVDIARYRNKRSLDPGETFSKDDVVAAAAKQGTPIEPRDTLLIRTGWLAELYREHFAQLQRQPLIEPGLTYSEDLAQWFHEMEIPGLATDTLANEVTCEPESGLVFPLHAALMRNLGVVFQEVLVLDELAEDCAADGQYSFLYVMAPLKVVGATGSPVNPIAIK